MKKNRRLLLLFTLLCFLFQSNAYSQLACKSNIVGALSSTTGGDATLKLFAQSVVENDDVPDLQISKDNVIFADFLTYDCDDVGEHVVYAKGTVDGTIQNCFSNLTVEDKIKPFPYAQNVTVSLNGGNSVTVLPSFVDVGSIDNCSIESMSLSQTTFTDNGLYNVIFTVTDPSGNSEFANVSITVIGGTPTCNESMYISLDIVGQADVPAEIFIEGNADYDVLEVSLDNTNFGESVSFDCDDIGGTTMVYVHIEQDGNEYNCTSEAMIEDKLAPVVVVEDFITIELESETDTYTLSVNEVDNGSHDNCSEVTMSLSQTEFTEDDWGQNQVILTVTDASGQSNSAVTLVTVLIDGQAPPLQCVSLSTAIADPWGGDILLWGVDFVINGEDYDQVLASLDPAGPFTESFLVDCGLNSDNTYTVYVKAYSGQEEYECFVELTVLDNTPPVAVAKQNLILVLENGSATLLPEDVDNGSYDACTDVELSLDKTMFVTADIGVNQVWLTITDENGNYNQTWTFVTVIDDSGCSLTNVIFPSNIEVFDESGTIESLSVENLQTFYGYAYEDVYAYTVVECESIFYTYVDQVLNSSYGFKVLRTWTALDWMTGDVRTETQILKLYTSYNNTMACNDQVSVSINSGPYTILPDFVLEGGPYDYDNMELVIINSIDEVVVDNIITADYIGETLYYTVTDITTGNSCWGTLIVDGMIEGCTLDDDDVNYPLPSIQLPEYDLDPWILSPEYLIENYGFLLSEVTITWPDEDCLVVDYITEDNIFDLGGGSFKIVRNIIAIDWLGYDPDIPNAGIWTFTQIITTGIDPSSLICDFLPRTADVGDCDSGHTLEDDVEWPANLNIADYRITPADLIEFSGVDVLDSEPSFYNNVDDYDPEYLDLVIELTSTTLVIGRVWTVNHEAFGFGWTYNQTITIDITDFDNLVTVNTGTNRAMPGVIINDDYSTNMHGVAYVDGAPIDNIEYEDEYLNGINVLDMILIQRHILGLGEMSEYGVLAADVNHDDIVKASDLNELRKRIQGVVPTDKGEWSFYVKEIESSITVMPKGGFVGVKSGDVDDTVLLPGEDPIETTRKFEVIDVLLNKGESYSVPVYLNSQINAYGLEFRAIINNDLLEVVDVHSDYGPYSEYNYHVTEEGHLVFMIAHPSDIYELGGGVSNPVLTIEFEAKENSLLSLAMDMNSMHSYIASSDLELIVLGGEIDNMIGTGTNSEELNSVSVYPNPTSEYLNFDLRNVSVTGGLEVSIYELNGQKLSTYFNSDLIDVSDLNSGMYYYQIKIDTYTTTGKFMVIK